MDEGKMTKAERLAALRKTGVGEVQNTSEVKDRTGSDSEGTEGAPQGFFGFVVYKCGKVAKDLAKSAQKAADVVIHASGSVHKAISDRVQAFSKDAKIVVVGYGQKVDSILKRAKQGVKSAFGAMKIPPGAIGVAR